MMGELKVLLGVMTGAVAQILGFWFNSARGNLPSQAKQSSNSSNSQVLPPTIPEDGEDTMRV